MVLYPSRRHLGPRSVWVGDWFRGPVGWVADIVVRTDVLGGLPDGY